MRTGIFGRGRLGLAIGAEAQLAEDIVLAWQVDKGEVPSGPVAVAIAASSAPAGRQVRKVTKYTPPIRPGAANKGASING